ncbi:MAG: NAD(P)H-dependent oxidoreductase, partial [Woeseia sp.]
MGKNKHLLIVYHSQSGSTSRMAKAVETGARHPDIGHVEVRLLDALAAGVDDLLWADGLILGTPENFGYMSGALKYFLDQVYYPCQDKVSGLPYALFVRAGNDGSGAISSVERIVSGLKLKRVHEPVLMCGDFSEQQLQEC